MTPGELDWRPLLLGGGIVILIALTTGAYGSLCCEDEHSESLRSGANDVIIVVQEDGQLKSTPFQIQVGKFSSFFTFWQSREGKEVQIFVNGVEGPRSLRVMDSGAACFDNGGEPTWTSQEWNSVPLEKGANPGRFYVADLRISIDFVIYLYGQDTRLVVTDVDGTITESDIKGHVYSALGTSAHHSDVIPLLESIRGQGYVIIYLTARSLAQDDETRGYLFGTLASEGLPQGPVFLSPKPLGEALLDSTLGSPRRNKAETLRCLLSLWKNLEATQVVRGAYGNREHDALAYRDAGIHEIRIYIVKDTAGTLLTTSKSGKQTLTSYREQRKDLENLYPKLSQLGTQ